MKDTLIYLDPDSPLNLQSQIRQKLVDAILGGVFPGNSRLPSSRKLAEQLGVARNTVVLAYEQLIDEGFLQSRERSGIYVSEDILSGRVGYHGPSVNDKELDSHWRDRIRIQTDSGSQFQWPGDWQQHPYPFIDGYFDSGLYPTAQWR